MSFVDIDGSYGEGGGQVLRNSTSLSALFGIPIKITKIRAGRTVPGLRQQHLYGMQLVAKLCSGDFKGGKVKSTEIEFTPKKLNSKGNYQSFVQSAGSIGLLLQISIPCIIFGAGETKVSYGGGTDVSHSPPYDETEKILLPHLSLFGVEIDLKCLERGFYPKGNGEVQLICKNPITELKPISILNRGKLVEIELITTLTGEKKKTKLAEDAEKQILKILSNELPKVELNSRMIEDNSKTNGLCITLIAKTDSGCLIGASVTFENKKMERSDKLSKSVTNSLFQELKENGCVDSHIQDQLIIYMTLANGNSKIRTGPLTLHTKTAIHFNEKLTGAKFNVEEDEDGSFIIECKGVGYKNKNM
eukprot:gene8536-360_t